MNPEIHLIINADDLGAGRPTDQGIIEAFTNGIVTSASLLANGPSFESAVEAIHETGLPIGVHLNLSEGTALTGPIPGLTDKRGVFLGKIASRQQFATGTFDPDHVLYEFIAQIDRIKRARLQPDHLDTHQHCGIFPSVTPALISAAQQTEIVRLRLSSPARHEMEIPPHLADEMRLYRQLAPQMTALINSADMTTPDGLIGMPLLDHLDEATLTRLLTDLPAGTWELMVHPGYFDPHRSFAGLEREQELTALTSDAIQSLIHQRRINLITFLELPCVC